MDKLFRSLRPKIFLRNVVAALIVAGLSAMLTVGVVLRPGRRGKHENEEA